MPIKKKAASTKASETSVLKVVDIPVENLIPDEDNPNEMDEAMFDLLVEEIREQGFDEPVLVRKHPKQKGNYQIGSGHHRVKAAAVCGMQSVPCVIKEWSDKDQKFALTKRNVMHGDLNKAKLAKLYKDLVKTEKDPVQLQRKLGFSNPKKFESMIEQVESQLPPKQRKKLQDAKEEIKSMDDLSSVLNRIFKEAGSELDRGYMVFSFGGKEHHYFQIDDETNKLLHKVKNHCDKHNVTYVEAMQSIVADAVGKGSLPTEGKGAKPDTKSKRPTTKRRKVQRKP